MSEKKRAGAFDLRNVIAALLGLYGLILLGCYFFLDPGINPDTGQAKNVSDNLWASLALLAVAADQRNEAQKNELAAHFRSIAPALDTARKQLAERENARKDLDARIPTTLITASVQPRMVRVLKRGNWMDDSGEEVTPAFPAVLSSQPLESPTRLTRQDLAKWIVSKDNPLTARVMVNRIWQGHFGEGLVRTPNDFGRMGAPPTHSELLDWLAARLGWSSRKPSLQVS